VAHLLHVEHSICALQRSTDWCCLRK